ncbi:MAG TPA: phosphatase PAP2 family protein, partial [Spirochaetota bacterium]
TSESFCAAAFLTTVYAGMHPGSKSVYAVAGTSFALAATVGFLRYRAGMHYPSDIIVGAIVGSAIGYLVPTLHRHTGQVGVARSTGRSIGLSLAFAL